MGLQLIPVRLQSSPSNYEVFLSLCNIKAHAEWNRLKLMKVIRSFVTDG